MNEGNYIVSRIQFSIVNKIKFFYTKMSVATKIGVDNIQRALFNNLEKDFSFIVNHKIYKSNSIVANILSPNISKNTSMPYYKIQTEFDGDFNQIIEYGKMKTITINDENRDYFINIMKKLGNMNEITRFCKELQGDITFENIIQRTQTKINLNINFDKEIAFISSNFHDLYTKFPKKILSFNVSIIEKILSSDNLKIFNEDELLDIVLKLYNKSKEYSSLFSYVLFLNVSDASIQRFKENFDINDINQSIWNSVFCRLEQNISEESMKAYRKSHKEFLNYRYCAKKHERIFEYLSERYHGNPQTQNIILITSSSIYQGKVENIIDQKEGTYFGTSDKADSWIQFDFKERLVCIESYTLKSCLGSHLMNWVLEVSNDGRDFDEIDQHKNCSLLCGQLKAESFNVLCKAPQRFVRLRQTGPNSSNNLRLWINSIEFSGYLYVNHNYK